MSPDPPKPPAASLQPREAAGDLSQLLPAVNDYIAAWDRNNDRQHQERLRELDNEGKELHFDHQKFTSFLRVLATIVFVIMVIAAGLLFYKDDTQTGVLLISHTVAVMAGLLAGLGLARRQQVHEE